MSKPSRLAAARALLFSFGSLLALAGCVEQETTLLADLPALPQGAGSVSIDMNGSWEIREALPVSYTGSAELVFGDAGSGANAGSGGAANTVFRLESGGSSTLERFLKVFRIGSELEIREMRIDNAEGLSLAEKALSSPDRINLRYVNQAGDRFAILHVLQESAPEIEPQARLTFWLLTGAVAEDRMVGRVSVQARESTRDLELDWWIGLRRSSH